MPPLLTDPYSFSAPCSSKCAVKYASTWLLIVCLLTKQIGPRRHVLVPIVHLIPSIMPGYRKGLDKYPLNTNRNKLLSALYLCNRPAKSETGLQVLFCLFKTHYITGEISLSITISRASSVQSLSRVRLFATPWTAAHQASLSITNSQSPPKPMSIGSVMPSNHLILCRSLLLLPSILPSIRVFSNELALPIRWPK